MRVSLQRLYSGSREVWNRRQAEQRGALRIRPWPLAAICKTRQSGPAPPRSPELASKLTLKRGRGNLLIVRRRVVKPVGGERKNAMRQSPNVATACVVVLYARVTPTRLPGQNRAFLKAMFHYRQKIASLSNQHSITDMGMREKAM